MLYLTYYSSPLGQIMLTSDGNNITGLWIEGQKYFAATVNDRLLEESDLPIFTVAKKWLDNYFQGQRPDISDLPLAPEGGEFRQAVWKILCKIPYGELTTYGDIAKKIAKQMNKTTVSSQAVGGAIGHNPIAIIIPCHRVVGKNGSLAGYAGGIDKKIKLLKLEGVDMSTLFVPQKGTSL